MATSSEPCSNPNLFFPTTSTSTSTPPPLDTTQPPPSSFLAPLLHHVHQTLLLPPIITSSHAVPTRRLFQAKQASDLLDKVRSLRLVVGSTSEMEDVEPGTAAKRQVAGEAYYYETAAAEEEEEERAWAPWLVPVFVLACVGFFVAEMYVNNCPAHSHPLGSCVAGFLHRFSFQPVRQNPLLGPSSSTLEKMGALEWNRVVHQNQGWRLLSCIWLHAGLVHLIVNMLSLIFIGIRLEQQFGFVRIGTIYILSGFGGAVLSALLLRNSISVGASGALFGLLGSMLSELITNWTIYSNRIAALLTLMIVIVINLAIGLFPSVDSFAHVGGFLSGFLLGFVLLIRPQFGWSELDDLPPSAQVTSKYKAYQYVLLVFGLILFVVGYVVGLVMLFRGVNGNDHCHWCHYLNCVPTSSWSCEN